MRRPIPLVLLFTGLLLHMSPNVTAQQDFEQWKQQQQQEFQQFQDARDKEFMNYLQQEWKDFQTFQGLVRDETPKPQDIPTAETSPKEVPEKPNAPKISPPPPQPSTPPEVTPIPPVPPEQPEKYQQAKFQFFGTPIVVQYDKAITPPVSQTINNETISEFWKSMGTADNKRMIEQVQQYRLNLELNDWGYALFINKFGESIYGNSPNSSTLFTWFVLLKSGYDVRVGFYENSVYLLLPSDNALYSIPYLTIDGFKYYIVPLGDAIEKPRGITSYEGDYPGETRRLDFRIPHSPVIAPNSIEKERTFRYLGDEYTVTVTLNTNTANFYNTYPQTDIPIYFGSTLSPEAASSLLNSLRPIVDGKSETHAVNLLLRFVQTAFTYETDDEQFGRENYLFPEETLYYPASDCEDRSALFAYLVRNLLDLEVIGLDYPGHIATAVKFSSDVGRDSITYDGETYTICDPTYINAEYGMTMPLVQGKKVTVFTFD